MFLRNLEDVRALFSSLGRTFAGTGITAYSRILPVHFIHPYHIICLRRTCDLPTLRKDTPVFCLEEELGRPVWQEGYNSFDLLADPSTQQFLRSLPGPKCLFLYQSYPQLETLAGKKGWELVANPAALRLNVSSRAFFQNMVHRLNLPDLPGGIYPLKELYRQDYEQWAAKLGPKFVIQLPDIRQGGGRGTFFIRSSFEYETLRQRLKGKTWRGVRIKTISLHRLVEGTPASIAVCLTRKGPLLTGLQMQLIDLPYCRRDFPENGIFCGHVWGNKSFPSQVIREARAQAERIAGYLGSMGYRGIFGVDFVVENRSSRIYPIEINPRLTGVFPVLSLFHLQKGLIPMEVFHILELLNSPYDADLRSLNEQYGQDLTGTHLLLFYPSGTKTLKPVKLEAGIYQLDPESGTCFFVTKEINPILLQNDQQFIIVDGPPDVSDGDLPADESLRRLCRILFRFPAADHGGNLSSHARQIVDWVYSRVFRKA